jgi:hypothetical protein
MDLSDAKTWTDGIKLVVGAPHIVGPLIAATAIAVWWFRGTVERTKRDGLQSIINGRDAQLAGKDSQLAGKDSQVAGKDTQIAIMTQQAEVTEQRLKPANEIASDLTTKLANTEKETEKLKKQLEEKASPEAIAATANSVGNLVTDTGSANTFLRDVLSSKWKFYPYADTPLILRSEGKPPAATSPSE